MVKRFVKREEGWHVYSKYVQGLIEVLAYGALVWE